MSIATATAEAVARLEAGPLADRTERNASLGERSTYRVGGRAAALVTIASAADAEALAHVVAATGVATLPIGNGSNLLVADRGFDGVAVALHDELATIDIDTGTDTDTETGRVVCGAAAKLPVVARATVTAGLTGFEWAVGVPGSIGGAVHMNAGGHGADMADGLTAADVVDLSTGSRRSWSAAELELGYRSSALAPHHLVLSATLELESGDVERGRAEMAEIVAWRRANQPGGPNAGSVFTNPPDDSAGRLIDTAGAKGLRVGTAEVSTKHANFIQADPGGSADDVLALMRAVQRIVADHHGIELHAETRLVGFGDR